MLDDKQQILGMLGMQKTVQKSGKTEVFRHVWMGVMRIVIGFNIQVFFGLEATSTFVESYKVLSHSRSFTVFLGFLRWNLKGKA